MHTTEIVVLGGGYTGMLAAVRAAHRTAKLGGRVTLVNPSARFAERLRMHQIATGQTLADLQIPALLKGSGVRFVQGRAAAVDTGRQVVTVGEELLRYDILVFAIGSVADTGAVPGAEQHTLTLNDPRSARVLAERLRADPRGRVVVCGGGLTGIEAAAEIAEQYPGAEVTILTRDRPGWMMSAPARAYLDRGLERLGVRVRAGVEIIKVLPDGVELGGGEMVPADAVLWTTGFCVPALAADAGLAVDERGRVRVDATLRSVSHPSVYAIGDAAAVRQSWGVIHGTCQSGIPTGAYAADAIAGRLRGRTPKPFRFGYIHQPVSLGRRDAVIQFTRADDTPRRWYLTGRAAVFYKESVTSGPPLFFRWSKRVDLPPALLSARGGRANRRGGA